MYVHYASITKFFKLSLGWIVKGNKCALPAKCNKCSLQGSIRMLIRVYKNYALSHELLTVLL